MDTCNIKVWLLTTMQTKPSNFNGQRIVVVDVDFFCCCSLLFVYLCPLTFSHFLSDLLLLLLLLFLFRSVILLLLLLLSAVSVFLWFFWHSFLSIVVFSFYRCCYRSKITALQYNFRWLFNMNSCLYTCEMTDCVSFLLRNIRMFRERCVSCMLMPFSFIWIFSFYSN